MRLSKCLPPAPATIPKSRDGSLLVSHLRLAFRLGWPQMAESGAAWAQVMGSKTVDSATLGSGFCPGGSAHDRLCSNRTAPRRCLDNVGWLRL